MMLTDRQVVEALATWMHGHGIANHPGQHGRAGVPDMFGGAMPDSPDDAVTVNIYDWQIDRDDTGNPDVRVPDATTVYHGPDQAEEAEVLASVLSVAELVEEPSLGEELELVMGGADWDGLATGESDGGDSGGGASLDDLESTSAAEDAVSCS